MNNNNIFGVSLEEIERQCSMHPIHCDKNSPINETEYLEPCIRGAKKIMEDEKKKEMIKKIYRR